MRRAALLLAVVASSLLLLACAPQRGAEVVDGIKTMQEERTPEKLLERGKAFANVGDLTRAEQYLSGALDAGADPAEVMPVLLRVCIQAKRYRVAIDYAEPVLRKRPADHHLRFVVASLHAVVGDIDAARAALEEIASGRPDDAQVHYWIAVLLRDEAGKRLDADKHFREYLRLAPGGAHAEEARASLLKVVPAPSATAPAPSATAPAPPEPEARP